ncbi:chain length determinant protein EpsF [Aquabacterium sp. A3]|uniref:chain length determinant protein EpsF n=1 Tax=Aquabacterium sp. A3 TaxID=3132829 RepID=UPI003119D7D6
MTFDQFLRILRARWKLAAGIFVAAVLITVIATLVFPKKYQASTTVLLDSRPDPVSAQSMNTLSAMSFLMTQIDVIESPAVAQRVVRLLRLDENPTLRSQWAEETEQRGDYIAWLGDLMSKGLKVKPSRESNVIEISYEGADPTFTAAMANAFAQAFIETTVQFRTTPARQYASFFEERAQLAREKLEKAQIELANAQKSKNIIASDERLDVENQKLLELSQQVLALKAIRSESSSKRAQANVSPDQTADVLGSPVVANLKSQLALQEAQLNQISERLGSMHPQVLELKASIETLRNRVVSETRRITGGVGVTANINSSRERDAVQAYEDQRTKVLQLKEARTELAVLERDVESAQRIYDAIQLRLSQINLESNNSQAGVMVLSKATAPVKHSSPNMLLNVVIATVLGALLSMMTALILELIDRRIRSADDLTRLLEVAVLGTLKGPTRKSGFRISGPSHRKTAALTTTS